MRSDGRGLLALCRGFTYDTARHYATSGDEERTYLGDVSCIVLAVSGVVSK